MYSTKKTSENKTFSWSQGMTFMLISTFCFSMMQAFIKMMPQFNSFQHIFFRSIIGWILSVSYLKFYHIPLIGKNSKLLVLRALVGSVSMFSFFYILTRIPFASSVALKYLSPIFTTIAAIIFLKEKVKPIQWLFFLMSFIGILIMKGFDTRISFFDLSIGILSAVFGGLLFIVIKKIGDDDHQLVILHYFMFISATVSGIICLFQKGDKVWQLPTPTESLGLLSIGLVGFFAQNYFTKAVQSSEKASILSNLRYLEAAYAFIIGYFVFNETYNLQSFMGLFLIFTGLLLSLKFRTKNVPID
ncbi:drug/metabolite transporter (DMT)-like permease [Arcicella aurantiaca]|uniref:Drug/metabolite transporter (DMT)-like permease n=1 Tax=Arcicella aurantiaca TaxID=591202 RepID=A0A316EFP6_9BACT|nr:DMT family transporter [Arcicella aurantiaca]PWK28523.1 drug/metabolite transporter (DMT)-like permease [Arcicella aurantiaca]